MQLALDTWQELPEGTIHIIPVRLDDCDVPEQFRRYHWANLFDPNGFDRIVRAIRVEVDKRPGTQDTGVEPVLINSIGMELVLIPAGTFIMGSPNSDAEARDSEKPAHRVTISQPFYLGKYPVTQAQWAMAMGNNPSEFTGHPDWPVERVSWQDVQVFIQKLNARESGEDYRLPTEAEWEYACRAGSTTSYCFGDDSNQLGKYAWYKENARGQPHPVGLRTPNTWGLYDMHGNVWEWVQDWYQPYPTDPRSASSGPDRVNRGGSWVVNAKFCRSAARGHVTPGHRAYDLGFRCASSGRAK